MHKVLKGYNRNGLMKLFLAFFTKALQTRDGPTDGRTDTRSYRDASKKQFRIERGVRKHGQHIE